MRNAIMLGAALTFIGLAGCHGVSPPNSPQPNSDLEGEAAHAAEGVDPKSGSTENTPATADKPPPVENKQPAEKPAPPEPPAPPPKP